MEGTKLSVLDKLPCWGRWLGDGDWKEREAEANNREEKEEGSLPLAPGPCVRGRCLMGKLNSLQQEELGA